MVSLSEKKCIVTKAVLFAGLFGCTGIFAKYMPSTKHEHKHTVSSLYNETTHNIYVIYHHGKQKKTAIVLPGEFLALNNWFEHDGEYKISIFKSKEHHKSGTHHNRPKLIRTVHFKKNTDQVLVVQCITDMNKTDSWKVQYKDKKELQSVKKA